MNVYINLYPPGSCKGGKKMHAGGMLSRLSDAWDKAINVTSTRPFPTLQPDSHLEFPPEVLLADFPSKGGGYYNEDVTLEEKWMSLPVLVPVVTIKINS